MRERTGSFTNVEDDSVEVENAGFSVPESVRLRRAQLLVFEGFAS